MKAIFYVLFVFLLPIFAQAQGQCVQFLSATTSTAVTQNRLDLTPNATFNSYFAHTSEAKFIGLAVKDSQGITHTILGPIIASGHRVLLEHLENKAFENNIEIREVLWAGELSLQLTPQRVRVLEVNEVAGLNANLQSNYLPHLTNSSSVRHVVEILNQNPVFEINAATRIEVFNPQRPQHILDFVSAKDFRHDMGNKFNVMSYVEMVLKMGRSFDEKTPDSFALSLAENLQGVIQFVQVYQREVGLKLPPEHQVLLDSLLHLDSQVSQIKTLKELDALVKSNPLLYESLASAYKLFMGQLTSEALVDISTLGF